MSLIHRKHQDNNYELKKFLGQLLTKWYWILASLLLSILTVYTIIKYTNETYLITASFNTKKFDKTDSNPLSFISSSNPLLQDNLSITQEIPLLKSQSRIQETLDRVNFNVSYFVSGTIKTTEVYPYDYYRVNCDINAQTPYDIKIFIKYIDKNTYQLSSEDITFNQAVNGKSFQFEKSYTINNWTFHIDLKNQSVSSTEMGRYFTITNNATLLNDYRTKLGLNWQNGSSGIINAAITSVTPEKDKVFMETYIQVIIDKGLSDKNEQYTNTIKFIDSYLPTIADTIRSFKKTLGNFEVQNRNVLGEESKVFQEISDLEDEKADLLFSNRYYDYLINYIKEERTEGVFAPVLVGLDEEPLSRLMNQYLQVQWLDKFEKNEFNKENPLINKTALEIEQIKRNLFENLANLKEANTDLIADLEKKIRNFYASLNGFQEEELAYTDIKTQSELYQRVYNSLIEKKTEAIITQASTVSDYELISTPKYNANKPVSPDKEKFYLIGVFLGLALPIGIIYLIHAMNDRIVTMQDLKEQTDMPIIGSVGHNPELDTLVILRKPKSLVAESFRGVRSSLQYLSKNVENKTILITSSVSGEGKTFSSVNLGLTFALLNHRVLIIGADMRKPSLAKNFNMSGKTGLSDFLANLCTIEDAVHNMPDTTLDVIPGGHIPPNPAELLLSSKMDDLMEWANKNYDHIIIDTPPINLVSDAFDLMKYACIKVLIVRQNVTTKNSFMAVDDMRKKEHKNGWYVLFNDIDFSKLAYGYKAYRYSYGAGYYQNDVKKRGFFKKLFKKNKS